MTRIHWNHEELGVVHTVKVQWRDSNEANFYIQCLCFIFASIVFNLLTISFAGRTVTPFSSRSHELMNESRLGSVDVVCFCFHPSMNPVDKFGHFMMDDTA